MYVLALHHYDGTDELAHIVVTTRSREIIGEFCGRLLADTVARCQQVERTGDPVSIAIAREDMGRTQRVLHLVAGDLEFSHGQ